MKQSKQRAEWTAFVLVLVLSSLLMPLDAFVFLSETTAASQGSLRIMPLGDSITYGQGSTSGGGYRLPLWQALQAQGVHITFVGSMQNGPIGFNRENQGLPGWKIAQISAHVVNWLRLYRPQIILLHIGTNDILKRDDPAHAPARLKHLIDQITATLPEAMLLVAQIIPIGRSKQLNAEVMTYNAAIPALVRAEAALRKHVQFVDMYHAVSPSWLPDGLHPNDRAYEHMARMWEIALLPLLRSSSRIS